MGGVFSNGEQTRRQELRNALQRLQQLAEAAELAELANLVGKSINVEKVKSLSDDELLKFFKGLRSEMKKDLVEIMEAEGTPSKLVIMKIAKKWELADTTAQIVAEKAMARWIESETQQHEIKDIKGKLATKETEITQILGKHIQEKTNLEETIRCLERKLSDSARAELPNKKLPEEMDRELGKLKIQLDTKTKRAESLAAELTTINDELHEEMNKNSQLLTRVERLQNDYEEIQAENRQLLRNLKAQKNSESSNNAQVQELRQIAAQLMDFSEGVMREYSSLATRLNDTYGMTKLQAEPIEFKEVKEIVVDVERQSKVMNRLAKRFAAIQTKPSKSGQAIEKKERAASSDFSFNGLRTSNPQRNDD